VISAEEGPLWRLYQRVATAVTVGGGIVMLALAAVAHSGASIALLIIGGAWLTMGLLVLQPDFVT